LSGSSKRVGNDSCDKQLQCAYNWAYSELFQNYDRAQIQKYLPGAIDISATDGLTIHFAETPFPWRIKSIVNTTKQHTLVTMYPHQA
jgi:hypothetical protein